MAEIIPSDGGVDSASVDTTEVDDHSHTSARSRGLVLLTVANVVYILGGYVLTVGIAHILGVSSFGSYGVVASFATVISMLITRGVPVAASRGVAGHRDAAGDWLAASRRVMIPLSISLGVLAFIAAWPVSAMLGDAALRVPMQIASLLALTFGLQSQLFAYMNGTENYLRQALGQMAYGIGRIVTIIGGAMVAGLSGAIAGFVIGPLLGALPLLGRRPDPRDRAAIPAISRTLVSSAVPIVITATGVTLLMIIDLIAFKRVATRTDVGLYVASATLAHIPYFLLQSASFVLLPAVAAAAASTTGRLGDTVSKGLTDMVILLSLPTAMLMSIGDEALSLIYGHGFLVSGGLVVAPLTLATAGVTIHGALVSIDAAMHKLAMTVVLSIGAIIALAASVTWAGAGSDIQGAALAVAVVCVALAVIHGGIVRARVGALFTARALVGIALSVAGALLVRIAPHNLIALFGLSCIIGVVWLILVFKLRIVDISRRPHADDIAELT